MHQLAHTQLPRPHVVGSRYGAKYTLYGRAGQWFCVEDAMVITGSGSVRLLCEVCAVCRDCVGKATQLTQHVVPLVRVGPVWKAALDLGEGQLVVLDLLWGCAATTQ